MSTLVIHEDASEERLALAAELLERCQARVVVEGVATLLPAPHEIECAVTEPMAGAARCEEEYKAIVENAARALRSSVMGDRLPDRPLRWVVVDPDETVTLWRET
jgi:hypothetical protein